MSAVANRKWQSLAVPDNPISDPVFAGLMAGLPLNYHPDEKIAVAVSGGGDSMALTILLDAWGRESGVGVVALTVDHALRAESADEARAVGKILKHRGIEHHILTWDGPKPKTGIQEKARAARYDLMTRYCTHHNIRYLFLAHHAHDQLETILFRLAKGSGVDGLAGMRAIQSHESGVTLVRPLLGVGHPDLLATCTARTLDWIEDPTNENKRYARVRIRGAYEVLEAEGLDIHRIGVLATRLDRVSTALAQLTEKEYKNVFFYKDTERIEIKYNEFLDLPEEIRVRVLVKVISELQPLASKKVRMEEVERMAARFRTSIPFKGATLGGCIFRKKKEMLCVLKEAKSD